MEIRPEVRETLDYLRCARRTLHSIPELNYQEYKSQAYLLSQLKLLKPDEIIPMAGTGIKVVFYARSPRRTTAFRADMDALPLQEETGVECASNHQGIMHACGHDAHMATALTLCKLVANNRDRLTENVVVLFQPAEERGCGADRMVNEGALANPKVDRIFTTHVWPGLPANKLGVRSGPAWARANGIAIDIKGLKAHGARPQEGHDAVVAAAALVTMIQSLISRRIAPNDSAVLTIGKLIAGDRCNIIAGEARLECTMRTYDDRVHDTLLNALKDMCKAVEIGYNVQVDLDVFEDVPGVINDTELYKEYVALAGDAAMEVELNSGAEDFAFYQREAPSFYALGGVGEDVSAIHSNTMFFDEECLLPTLEMYMRILGL